MIHKVSRISFVAALRGGNITSLVSDFISGVPSLDQNTPATYAVEHQSPWQLHTLAYWHMKRNLDYRDLSSWKSPSVRSKCKVRGRTVVVLWCRSLSHIILNKTCLGNGLHVKLEITGHMYFMLFFVQCWFNIHYSDPKGFHEDHEKYIVRTRSRSGFEQKGNPWYVWPFSLPWLSWHSVTVLITMLSLGWWCNQLVQLCCMCHFFCLGCVCKRWMAIGQAVLMGQ